METALSITVEDDTASTEHSFAPLVWQEELAREPGRERLTRAPSAGRSESLRAKASIPVFDDRMRLPSFEETCPHVSDKIISLNGGRFNVDHYLRVLRAKAEIDASLAMALTV